MDPRDQDSAEEYCELSLQQVRQIMNDTHRFKRFLNNSAFREMDFAVTSCFVKMIIRSDTPPPKGKLLQVLLGRTDRYGSLSRNRNDVM